MNIAYILPEFVTEKEAGGLATYYDNISRLLADKGHKITVFVQSEENRTIDYYPGIIVERVYADLKNINPDIPGSFIRAWSAGLKNALCNKIAKGMIYDLVQYPNFMGYGLDRIDVPTVVRVSSYRPLLRAADKEYFNVYEKYSSIKVPDYIEDIAVMKADGVYGPSETTAVYIKEQTGREIEVIESPYYPRINIQNTISKDKKWIKNKKYIITFGTLKILKGAKLIGDCVFEIMEKCPNLFWVFAGTEIEWMDEKGKKVKPSEYIREHAKQYSDRIVFLGKLKQEEALEYVKDAAFCVLPSRVDNLPNTCIEAMALGKVVIGTIGASFEQLIVNGKNGFLVERENKESLVSTVCKAYELSQNDLYSMGLKAKQRIEKMAPEIILNQLIDFYGRVIENYHLSVPAKDAFYNKIVNQYNEILKQTGIKETEHYLL